MKIKIIEKNNKYIKPVRKHFQDVGADVATYYDFELRPNETKRIPLGFGLEIPNGFQAIIQPRSGLASRGIVSQIAPIDPGYTGEIHCIITNTSDRHVSFLNGDRIGQIVVTPVIIADFYSDEKNTRGDNGFGSTDKW